MEDIITSSNNNIVKYIRSLHQKSERDKLNQYFVEGQRIVQDAIESNADIEFIVVSETYAKEGNALISLMHKRGMPIHVISDKLIAQISDTQTPQGIIAVINKNNYTIDDIDNKDSEFLVLLENIQDPGNMGTIIRTADAAGVSGIIVSKGCVDTYNPKVLRSTMGSIFHVPIIKVDDFQDTIKRLKQNRFNIYGAHLDGNRTIFDVDVKSKTGVIIGNEANGISGETAKMCTLVKIPMPGSAESLNASVSAGIIIYEYVRQKLSR